MLYLLAIGWPWFAAALAIGLGVGWLTTTRVAEGEVSGRWLIGAALLLLGAGGVISFAEWLPGRGGLTLDAAWLAGLAYFAGLPLGGAAKSLAPAPAPEPKKPPVVVVRGAPREEFTSAPAIMEAPAAEAIPAPVLDQAAPAPAVEETPAPAVMEAPAAEAITAPVLDVAPAPAPKPAETRSFPGARPASLEAPRGGAPDDLAKIKGIGPKSVEKLHSLGVFHYDQIAAWTLDNARWIGAALGASGRVERGKWIQQARALVAGGAKH